MALEVKMQELQRGGGSWADPWEGNVLVKDTGESLPAPPR